MTAASGLVAGDDVDGVLGTRDAAEVGGNAVGTLVRRRADAGLGRHQETILGVDEGAAPVVRHLEARGEDDRVGRARLFAETAEDAAQLVDLVARGVALSGRA